MPTPTPARYHLQDRGHLYEVETHSAGLSTVGRLFVDGVQRDEQKSKGQSIHLQGGGLTVAVSLNWLDQVKQILAVPAGDDPKKADEEVLAFAPPAVPGGQTGQAEA